MESNNINKGSIKKATIWSAVITISRKLLIPISNMVLARILTPDVFGIVATIHIVISFAEALADAGFQKYLIQHEFEDEEALYRSANVAFYTNFGLSFLIWIAISLFRRGIAISVGCEGYEVPLVVAALAIPLWSLSSIQQAIFKRNFDFKGMFVPNIVSSILPWFVAIPIALIRKDYWALIIGANAQQLSNAILFYLKSKWKPRLYYKIKLFKEMFSFSMWTMFESLSIWLSINIDAFICGKILSHYYLGLYITSITTTQQVTSIITAIILPVLFTALSKVQNDDNEFQKLFYEFQRKSALLLVPLSLGIMLFHNFITNVLLGNQWDEAARLIGMIGMVQAFRVMISFFASEVYRAKGEPFISFIVQFIYLLITAPVLYFGAHKGFHTLSLYRISLYCFFVMLNIIMLIGRYKFKLWKMIQAMIQPAIASLGMVLFYCLFSIKHKGMLYDIFSIVICASLYFAICFVLPDTRKVLNECSHEIIRYKAKH